MVLLIIGMLSLTACVALLAYRSHQDFTAHIIALILSVLIGIFCIGLIAGGDLLISLSSEENRDGYVTYTDADCATDYDRNGSHTECDVNGEVTVTTDEFIRSKITSSLVYVFFLIPLIYIFAGDSLAKWAKESLL